MAQQALNNNMSAKDFRSALNANFTELYNKVIPKDHSSTATTYGVGTTSKYGHLKVSAGNGLGVNNGAVTMGIGSTSAFGTVRLASNINSNSDNVITSTLLRNALRGQTTVPRIFYGTSAPTASNPANSANGDIYIRIE